VSPATVRHFLENCSLHLLSVTVAQEDYFPKMSRNGKVSPEYRKIEASLSVSKDSTAGIRHILITIFLPMVLSLATRDFWCEQTRNTRAFCVTKVKVLARKADRAEKLSRNCDGKDHRFAPLPASINTLPRAKVRCELE